MLEQPGFSEFQVRKRAPPLGIQRPGHWVLAAQLCPLPWGPRGGPFIFQVLPSRAAATSITLSGQLSTLSLLPLLF